MGKILAAIIGILIIWYGFPYYSQGLWIAPTAIAPDSWMADLALPEAREYLATPSRGYDFYRFDFWNDIPNPDYPLY